MEKLKIVLLDGYTVNPGDLSWGAIENLGELTVYDRTPKEKVAERSKGADILITSKCLITKALLDECPRLRYIGSTATGYNNIDIEACRERGIGVANVPAYAADAVAQHTFALMLEICDNVGLHNSSVKDGEWCRASDFTYWKSPMILLTGKSLGIIGYGNIGKKVAEIAKAFGMTVNVYSKDKAAAMKSDFVSLHCPATPDNIGLINKAFISQMKDGAVLINTARGVLINEDDLADALLKGKLWAAGVDVLSSEPPAQSNPLLSCPNCFITPHMGWIPKEMRDQIIRVCADNLKNFLGGGKLNRVD